MSPFPIRPHSHWISWFRPLQIKNPLIPIKVLYGMELIISIYMWVSVRSSWCMYFHPSIYEWKRWFEVIEDPLLFPPVSHINCVSSGGFNNWCDCGRGGCPAIRLVDPSSYFFVARLCSITPTPKLNSIRLWSEINGRTNHIEDIGWIKIPLL